MRDRIAIARKWDHKLWNDREQAYNSKIAERNHLLKLYPEKKNLINDVHLRNELVNYENNEVNKIIPNFQNFRLVFGFGNVSYFRDFEDAIKFRCESDSVESEIEENTSLPKTLPFCAGEAGQSQKLGTLLANQSALKHIHSWFPIWQDGVCRLVGQLSSSKNTSKPIITGAILSYSETCQTFKTVESNYKFSENIDKKSLAKYMRIDPSLPLDMYCSLRQENWLENIVRLSLQSEYDLFRFSGASTKKFFSKDRKKSVITLLFERRPPKNLGNLTKSGKCSDYESICKELEDLLEVVKRNEEWLKPLQRILKKCGQSADLVNNLKNNKSFHDPFSFRENDLGVSFDSLTYEDFNSGKKFNSTFTNVEAQLVFWSIVRDDKDRFCITGLKLMDRKNKFYQIKPAPITTVIEDGRAVIADKCCYELLGPLYALPVRLTYPNFVNCDYLWIFLPYFTTGLPTNWKTYIYIIDILSKCTLLTYVPTNISAHNLDECNLSEKTMINHSPSFIPSISVLSPSNKDLGNDKENKGSCRRSIKRNSILNSNYFHENNTNNEENDVFKANDKAICQRLSDMTNVFCSWDQTENNFTNRKSILKNRISLKSVCATASLGTNSMTQKSHEVSVVKKDIPLNLENDQVNLTHGDSERKINRQSVKWGFDQPSQSYSTLHEQEVLNTPVTKVKNGFKRDKKINNLRKVISEDFQNLAQIFGDLDSSQSIGRTASNTAEMDQSQSQTPSQTIRSRKRKLQQLPAETYSEKKKLKNVEEIRVSQNCKSIGNEKIKMKNTCNVEESRRKYNRKSVINAKPDCSSDSKVRFSKSLDTSNQTIRVRKRTSVNKSAKTQISQCSLIDSEWINSDKFFQPNIFFNKTRMTRSGRKSIPPIDPRSCIERLNEGGKSYLVSKGQKFELLPNDHPS